MPAPPATLPPGLAPIDDTPSTQEIVIGNPEGRPKVGLVIKRTYRILDSGSCKLADGSEQDVLLDSEIGYYEAEPPFVAPVAHDNDMAAFRPGTDLVIQGFAHAYERQVTKTVASVRLRKFSRVMTVHGDRTMSLDDRGRLSFTPAEPFQKIPLRYDRAYGGVDLASLVEPPNQAEMDLRAARPDLPWETATPFHYPRNPAGVGFMIRPDPDFVRETPVPNLEFSFDPVTPERVAVGTPESWHEAPLPAGVDWISGGWFPRVAYLGYHGFPDGFEGTYAELEQGWVPKDLLTIRPFIQNPGQGIRGRHFQGASPGMSFGHIPLSTPVELGNIHPRKPAFTIWLPTEWPAARLELRPGKPTDLEPHLNAVIIRPEDEELVTVWCAHADRKDDYTPAQYAEMRSSVEWRQDERRS